MGNRVFTYSRFKVLYHQEPRRSSNTVAAHLRRLGANDSKTTNVPQTPEDVINRLISMLFLFSNVFFILFLRVDTVIYVSFYIKLIQTNRTGTEQTCTSLVFYRT